MSMSTPSYSETWFTVTLTGFEAHMILNALIVAERTQRRDADAASDRHANLHRANANQHHYLISRLDREFDRQFTEMNA